MKNTLKIIFGLLMVALIVGCIPATEKRTINTNGQATIKVQPDEAVVYVAVETLKDTAQAAKNSNSEITDKVYAALYKINVPRESIETSYFNIYEDFDWTQNGQVSKGFKAVHNMKITTKNFDDVGKIIDAVIDAGATRIDSISFDISEERQSELKKQALTEATTDAREKADAMAAGLGAKILGVLSVSDSGYNYMPYPLYAESMGMKALDDVRVSTEISPQTLEVTANVNVVYEIR